MKKILILFLGVLCLQSCSSLNKSMREPNVLVRLEKQDFEFSEQVTASAQSQKILGIDWARLLKKETGTVKSDIVTPSSLINAASIPVIGSFLIDPTANYALFELMKNNPGYDVVFYPQYETSIKKPILGLGFLYKKTNVTVTAKLAKIK